VDTPNEQPNEAHIRSYFEACSTGTAGDIARHFTIDAVVYDTNIAPVWGSEAIGEAWVAIRNKWGGATWNVDSCVESGNVAAIEWSMRGVDPKTTRAFVFRGSEHYVFEAGRIAEIRQYWTFDRNKLDTGLVGFNH
jgi:ketosteroid isomerase-like protein